MQYKRLRSSKKIESLSAAKLSGLAKEQLREAVYTQFAEIAKIQAEFGEVTDGINNMGYLVLKTGHDFNEYFETLSGSANFSPVKTEICAFVSELCFGAEKFIKRNDQSFLLKVPEEKIFVNIDKERFCYAVLNVILNAAENTKPGGRIRLSVSKTKKFVKITVGDNGKGMDEESLLRCFEPFYSKSNSSKKGKMGLGLTLTRNFVTESGGRMGISSKEGKGTTVSMLFPIVDEAETNLKVESSVPDILGGKFSPVMIVFSALEKD